MIPNMEWMEFTAIEPVRYGPDPPESAWRVGHHTGCCDWDVGCGDVGGCDCIACEWYDRCCCECSCGTQP